MRPKIGPPLKIMFPVHRPGELMSAEWIHFFHISVIIFFSAFSTSFLYREKHILKKRKILWPPDSAVCEIGIFFHWPGGQCALII